MANTGRTNAKYVSVLIDNTGGTLTDLTAYLKSVNGYGLKFTEQDVTGVSDAIANITIGRPAAPLSLTWQIDTTVCAHLTSLVNRNTPLSLDIRMGILHSWVTGEPTFGISSDATHGYVLTGYNMTDTEIQTTWNVMGGTAPDFATTAHV